MRLARIPAVGTLAVVAAIAVAGCASSANAGWTFAPVPSVTPAPSVAASGGPTPSGAVAPSAAPPTASPLSSAPPPAPSASAEAGASTAPSGGASVSISALNIEFQQTSVDAPAGQPFTILFNNMDSSVPHDVWIKDATGNPVFQGGIVTGPAQTTYNVPALIAGTYTFSCSVHPNMTGTMVVK